MPSMVLLLAQILPLVPGMIAGVKGAVDAFNEGTALLQIIVAEKREPTDAEWGAWSARVTAAHQAIQSA